MIEPTVGRIVWYRPGVSDGGMARRDDQPFAAKVAYVHSNTLVNLVVTDHDGYQYPRQNIYLDQDSAGNQTRPYCEWMPFQKDQAAKAAQTISAQLGQQQQAGQATLGGQQQQAGQQPLPVGGQQAQGTTV